MAKVFSFIILMLSFVACKSNLNFDCEPLLGTSETVIYDSNQHYHYGPRERTKCWIKKIPTNSMLIFKFESLSFSSNIQTCSDGHINVTEWEHDDMVKETTFCSSFRNKLPDPFVAFQDVMIEVYYPQSGVQFALSFTSESPICHTKGAFQCSYYFCVPRDKVCDGVKDCANGLDESNCGPSFFTSTKDCVNKLREYNCNKQILSVEGIEESRLSASYWLERNSNSSAWKNNMHRTIVSLYLSGKSNFANRDYTSKSNLLAKQLELDAAVALLRNSTDPVSSNELSMYINALLVTCRNPREFYGFNLVQLLLDTITRSDDTIQPVAYLTLCNANETLTETAIDQLLEILDEDSEYILFPGLKAITVMTISCLLKRGQTAFLNESDIKIYEKSVQNLKMLQNEDGSFGNVYTTALILQALISKGDEYGKDWNTTACVNFLIKQLKSTTDYFSTYYILPILNAKSLADISNVKCTGFSQTVEENPISNLAYKLGPKMQIQYSLYLGANKDVIHTIYLTVPEKISVHKTMLFAALADPKYKFQSNSVSGKNYVFGINDYIDDPERGLFWLSYIESERFNDSMVQFKTSPDETELQENDHLIMWYKRPNF